LRFRGQVLSKDGTLDFRRKAEINLARPELDIAAADRFGFDIGAALRREIGGRIVWDA